MNDLISSVNMCKIEDFQAKTLSHMKMKMLEVPPEFQPNYVSSYPPYSSGKNTEEICYEILKNKIDEIETEYIYIPIFWTSIYTFRSHNGNFDDIYDWLEKLDKSKKYFTIVQNDCGIFVRNFDLNIKVFSAGGGGVNIKNSDIMRELEYNGVRRFVFVGNKGDYDIPLMCLPLLVKQDVKERDIYCSFAGRYDTHWCRFKMVEKLGNLPNLSDDLQSSTKLVVGGVTAPSEPPSVVQGCELTRPEFKFFESTTVIKNYNEILSRSIFTLAPRGFGYTSFRLFEAIHCESIPIYVWEDKCALPFSDILDWKTFSIVININEIDNLPNLLKEVNIEVMQENVRKVKEKFTYEYITEYIKQIVCKSN